MDVIAAAGDKLWKELIGSTDTKTSAPLKITNVQLSFAGIAATAVGQKNIDGFFRTAEFVDGESAIHARPDLKRKRSSTPSLALQPKSPKPATDVSTGFTCSRCGKHLALPEGLLGPAVDEEVREDGIVALRLYVAYTVMEKPFELTVIRPREHDDFHIAQELSRSGGRRITVSDERPPIKVAKKKTKPKSQSNGGIAKFFS